MKQLIRRLVSWLRGSPLEDEFETTLKHWLARAKKQTIAATAPAAVELKALPLKHYASIVIPALNEAKRIAQVVTYARSDEATAEVIVIDDCSVDDTAELARSAGARVVLSSMLGKGASMRDGVGIAQNDIVVFLDGDLAGLQPRIISDLCVPILRDEADFVKAKFGRSGGRVTELTAKPMLKVFFPELAHVTQPLGGIVAARRSLLDTLEFDDGYGVDVNLLIDAQMKGARIAEVDIGAIEHESQPLVDLAAMANEVSRVIYRQARAFGRLHVEQIAAMFEAQRQATADVDYVLSRRRGRTKLLLLDMDGTLTPSRFAVELARATGRDSRLMPLLDAPNCDAATRSEQVAEVFRFLHKSEFERVARGIELRAGAIEFVNRMRRAGFMVGIVSDSYFVAAEIVRRRLFADFALAHTLQFESDVCTGKIRLNPAFYPNADARSTDISKAHVLRYFRNDPALPRVAECWAVGDNANDVDMLIAADRAFAMEPKVSTLGAIVGVRVVHSFAELLSEVPETSAQRAAA